MLLSTGSDTLLKSAIYSLENKYGDSWNFMPFHAGSSFIFQSPTLKYVNADSNNQELFQYLTMIGYEPPSVPVEIVRAKRTSSFSAFTPSWVREMERWVTRGGKFFVNIAYPPTAEYPLPFYPGTKTEYRDSLLVGEMSIRTNPHFIFAADGFPSDFLVTNNAYKVLLDVHNGGNPLLINEPTDMYSPMAYLTYLTEKRLGKGTAFFGSIWWMDSTTDAIFDGIRTYYSGLYLTSSSPSPL